MLASDQLEKAHDGATLLGGGDGFWGTPYPVHVPFPRPIYVSVLDLRSQLVQQGDIPGAIDDVKCWFLVGQQ